MVLTLCLCVLYGSQNKQRLLPYTSLADWFCIIEVESVYSAVRTESLYEKTCIILPLKELRLFHVYVFFVLSCPPPFPLPHSAPTHVYT